MFILTFVHFLLIAIAYGFTLLIFLTLIARILFYFKHDIDPIKAVTPDISKLLEVFDKEKKAKAEQDYQDRKRMLA